MNNLTLSSTCIIFTTLSMIFLLIVKGERRKISLIWGLLCLSLLIWGLAGFQISLPQSYSSALFWWRIGHIGIIFIPTLFFHFVYAFLNLNQKHLIRSIYAITSYFLLIALLFPELFFGKLRFLFNQFFWVSKTPHFIAYYFLLCFLLLSYAFYLLIINFKMASGLKKIQIKYFILAGVIAWFGGSSNFLITMGLDLYPFFNFTIVFYPIIIVYSIIKHQLLDIDVVVRKGLIYSFVILLLALGYVLIVTTLENLLRLICGYHSTLISLVTIFIIGLVFFPLHSRVQQYVDRFIFKRTHEELTFENQLLRENAVDSEKMKTVATLASGIAHEIRNPLTSLKTFVEYFPKKKNDPEFIAKFESLAGTEITRIEKILQELLEFSKPSPLTLTATNINSVITHALNLTSNQLAKNNITVQTDLCPNLPIIQADSNKLLQVFINLILNANEAMSVNPKDQSRDKVLRVTTQVTEGIEVTIADTGCGIAQKDLAKIFDPFFSTKQSGTGLGLSIVKGIIEDHGGKISVMSEVGKGTEFKIQLPCVTEKDQIT